MSAAPVSLAPVSWQAPDLEPRQAAETALIELLRSLAQVADANLTGCRAGLDSEYLHQLRIAVRRARSLTKEFRKSLPASQMDGLRRQLAWLGKSSGPVRDLDVLTETLPPLAGKLTETDRLALAPLAADIGERRRRAQEGLRQKLLSAEFTELMQTWLGVQASAEPSAQGQRPIQAVAAGRIWRLYRNARRCGLALDPLGPIEPLHELRKRLKALRYLLESFRQLFRPKRVERLLRDLKALQDVLGSITDAAVQEQALVDALARLGKRGHCDDRMVLVVGGLCDRLGRRQRRARRRFGRRFAEFAADRQRYRALFREPD